MYFLNQCFVLLIVCALCLVKGQKVPSTPCPDIFHYYQRPSGNVYGRIIIPNDGSTTLIITVNASMKGYYNGKAGLQINLDTPSRDLIEGEAKTLHYTVEFPFQQSIPKITRIILNNRGYCTGPPEEVTPGSSGVTSMWSEHRFFFEKSHKFNNFPPSGPIDPVENFGMPVTSNQRYPEITFTSRPPNRLPDTFDEPTSTSRRPPKPTSTSRRPPNPTSTISRNPYQGCGVARNTIVPLILGGTDISDGVFPWLTAMFVSKGAGYEYKCTANLVSEKHVLTAARCINYYKVQIVQAEHILFVFGKIDLHKWATSGAVARGAIKIQTNPDFDQASGHGDVSIITLDRALEFSKTISPICLWTGNNDFSDIVGKIGTVAGWGADEGLVSDEFRLTIDVRNNDHDVLKATIAIPSSAQKAGQYSVSVAKSLEMPIVSNTECLNSNLTYYSLTSDMTFCAGQRDGTGTCVGDNGAAFMMVKKGKYYLRGLASLTLNDSDGKCDLNNFMIFCDVAKFSTWIETSMKE